MKVRERLITHDEYLAVNARAAPSVQLAMALRVRRLCLPADVLRLDPRNLVKDADGRRTLRFRSGNANVQIEMEIVGDLAAALTPFIDQPSAHPTFVQREVGKRYSISAATTALGRRRFT